MLFPDSWGSGGCAKDEVPVAEVRILWVLVNDRSICIAATMHRLTPLKKRNGISVGSNGSSL